MSKAWLRHKSCAKSALESMPFQHIELKARDPDRGLTLRWSRRDLPPDQYLAELLIDDRFADSFYAWKRYVEPERTFIYTVARSQLLEIFNRNGRVHDAFPTELEFMEKMREGV